jgi:hypothetical protein
MADLLKHIPVTGGNAKAWFSYDQSGAPAIDNSVNISSITDNGAGSSAPAFTNAFSDALYIAISTSRTNTGTRGGDLVGINCGASDDDNRTTSDIDILVVSPADATSNAAEVDRSVIMFAFLGDLA